LLNKHKKTKIANTDICLVDEISLVSNSYTTFKLWRKKNSLNADRNCGQKLRLRLLVKVRFQQQILSSYEYQVCCLPTSFENYLKFEKSVKFLSFCCKSRSLGESCLASFRNLGVDSLSFLSVNLRKFPKERNTPSVFSSEHGQFIHSVLKRYRSGLCGVEAMQLDNEVPVRNKQKL